MSSDEYDQKAQQAALQEKVIEALHEDEHINHFLYLGQDVTPALFEDTSFQERVTCVEMGLEEAIKRQDLSGIFQKMIACAREKNAGIDVPRNALQSIMDHARAYNDGKYKPKYN